MCSKWQVEHFYKKGIWSLSPSILHCINPYSNTILVLLKTFKVITAPGKCQQCECTLVCLYVQGLSRPVGKPSPFPLTGFLIGNKISSHPKQTGSSFSASLQRKTVGRVTTKADTIPTSFLTLLVSLGTLTQGAGSVGSVTPAGHYQSKFIVQISGRSEFHDLILFPSGTWCRIQLTEHLKAA